jgi:hypothetical protein
MFGIIALAVIGILSLIIAYVAGAGGFARSVAPGNPVENDPQIGACEAACRQLHARHLEHCNAEADQRDAQTLADMRHSELNTALTTAGALLAAAIAAAAIAVVGWIAAAPLFAAAAAASIVAAYIGGLVSRDARTRETEAHTTVSTTCALMDANTCFAGLSPCS